MCDTAIKIFEALSSLSTVTVKGSAGIQFTATFEVRVGHKNRPHVHLVKAQADTFEELMEELAREVYIELESDKEEHEATADLYSDLLKAINQAVSPEALSS